MKTILQFTIAVLIFNSMIIICSSQNLVPNPSFEEYDNCPQTLHNLEGYCKYWTPFRGTPDYYNTCSPVGMAPPNCPFGFQYAHTGNSFTGFVGYQSNETNMMEQLGVKLESPLIIGTKYYLSFFVNTAYNSVYANLASNKIAALLTTYQYTDTNWLNALPNTCTIKEDVIVVNTSNWIKISGSFVSDSTYNYLVIGCFYDDNHLDTIHYPYSTFPTMSYYNLDDVCLSTDSVFCENWTGLNCSIADNKDVSIYPNPILDQLTIVSNFIIRSVQVYNLNGQLVIDIENANDKLIKLPVDYLNSGLYIIKIKTTNNQITKKININHD